MYARYMVQSDANAERFDPMASLLKQAVRTGGAITHHVTDVFTTPCQQYSPAL